MVDLNLLQNRVLVNRLRLLTINKIDRKNDKFQFSHRHVWFPRKIEK